MKLLNTTVALILAGFLIGCAGMSDDQQRMLSGGAMGAGGGAVLGAVAGGSPMIGAIVGGAAGVTGGAIVNHRKKAKITKTKEKKTAAPSKLEARKLVDRAD